MRAPLKRAWSADGGQVRLVPDKSDKPFYRPQHGSQHVVAELRECWRLGRPLSRWFLLAPSGSFHPGAKYRAMSTGFPPTSAHRCLQMFSEDPSHEISCVVFPRFDGCGYGNEIIRGSISAGLEHNKAQSPKCRGKKKASDP